MKELGGEKGVSRALPGGLESFVPEAESIYLLSKFFTKYARIAYVSLYKQSVMRMSDSERARLYRYEVEQEREIALRLGGIGPEMFERGLFNPEVEARQILVKEGVYSSLKEIKKDAAKNPRLLTYVIKLDTVFREMIDGQDCRHLRYTTNRYQEYIAQILSRPEYRARTQKRAREMLDEMRLHAHTNLSPNFLN